MAEDPRAVKRAAKRRAATTARGSATRGITAMSSWDFRRGVWYNADGKVMGYAASEDSEISKSPGMAPPNANTDPRRTSRGKPREMPHEIPQFPKAGYRRDGTVPPDQADNPPSPDTGQFNGEDLAKVVKPSGDLSQLGGQKLDDKAAQQIIMQRLEAFEQTMKWDISIGEQGTVADRGDLAEIIIDALPADLRTDNVAANLDLRPYLKALDGKPILHREATPFYLPDATATWKAHTKPYLDAAETRATEDAVVAGASGGTPVSTKYDPTKAGVVPTATAAPVVDPTTGQVSTPGVTVGPNGEISFGTPGAVASPFTIDDLRQMVQGDHWTLQELAANEDQSPTGQFPIDVGTQQGPRGGAVHGVPVSTNDALSYLRTQLTPQQIHDMQLKLASAGYFDKLDNGGTYIDGVVDDNTQQAWKMLLTDSVIQNRPAPVILGEGLRNYRDQVRTSRLQQLSKLDPSYTRAVANDYAQSTIGRDLTPDEAAQVHGFLTKLVSQRAGYVAGAGDNQAGQLQGDFGVTKADTQAALDANPAFDWEKHTKGMGERLFRLNQVLG